MGLNSGLDALIGRMNGSWGDIGCFSYYRALERLVMRALS